MLPVALAVFGASSVFSVGCWLLPSPWELVVHGPDAGPWQRQPGIASGSSLEDLPVSS